ncbi:MAG: two-component system, chemotaxis family, protein-glutamate methylesterase/glutaminase [Candidatus Atribacteria bacterium]|nr:two-component system, chemotaxis family, protein-glutamate methylesterase/glutaminase [Candidatus Atribacteria bacterium]
MKKIKVMVVDDSSFMRKIVSDLLNSDPGIEVITTARDGLDAWEQLRNIDPDVILLDVEMPRLDGLALLGKIFAERPRRVVMLSALTQEGSEITIQALERGALDFISKPSGSISLDIEKKREEIITKVKLASTVPLSQVEKFSSQGKMIKKPLVREKEGEICPRLVFVAASTGGPKVLYNLISELSPLKTSGILIVQHMPAGFTKSLAERLNNSASLPIKEADSGDKLVINRGLLAPGGKHLLVEEGKEVSLSDDPPVKGLKPCADITLLSAIKAFEGRDILAVVMTGMGKDALEGCRVLKKKGGTVIAQDESTSLIFGMPRAVIEEGLADKVLPLPDIPSAILEWDSQGKDS